MDLVLSRWKDFVIVLVIWAGIYLPSLGTPEFKGEEGRRVLPAVTMLETGDWIVPSVGGEDYHSKPPGINWLVAISFMITGEESEFAARLPSALFVLLFVVLLFWMRSPCLSISARLISAIVFMTCVGIVEKGRLIEIEAVYVSLCGIAILWWLNIWSRKGSKWSLWIVPAVVMGYGMLVKGPFILIFFYFAVAGVLFYEKRFKEIFSIQHILGVSIILIMFLSWTYLAYQHTNGSRMTNQMISQLMIRIIRKPDLRDLGLNISRAFGNLLPWLLFILTLCDKRLTSQIKGEHFLIFKGCRLGMLISFTLINLMPGGQPRYSMPVIPLFSILLGWTLSLRKDVILEDLVWRKILLGLFILSSLTSIAGLIFLTSSPAAFIVSALTVCVTVIIFQWRFLFDSTVKLAVVTGVLAVVIMLQYSVFGMLIITSHQRRRPAAYAVNNNVPAGETIYVFKPGYQAFLFYVRPPLKYVLSSDEINDKVHYLLLEEAWLTKLRKEQPLCSRTFEILYEIPKIRGNYRLVKVK